MAILVELVGNFFARGDGESHAREKLWDAREQTHEGDFLARGLLEQSINQAPPGAVSLRTRIHCNRAHFGQMRSVEMQGAASHNAFFALYYDEVADVLTDFRQCSRQQGAVARIACDQVVDLCCV